VDLIQSVRKSYDRCVSNGDFAATFYEIFFTKSPEIPKLFVDTDFTQQKRHFRASVLLLIKYQPEDEVTRAAMAKIGQSHCRGERNIRPDLYPLFLASVCEAIRKHDPDWTAELEGQWQERIQGGVELIISMY
jgi:hemoglobin-like flavoprotein